MILRSDLPPPPISRAELLAIIQIETPNKYSIRDAMKRLHMNGAMEITQVRDGKFKGHVYDNREMEPELAPLIDKYAKVTAKSIIHHVKTVEITPAAMQALLLDYAEAKQCLSETEIPKTQVSAIELQTELMKQLLPLEPTDATQINVKTAALHCKIALQAISRSLPENHPTTIMKLIHDSTQYWPGKDRKYTVGVEHFTARIPADLKKRLTPLAKSEAARLAMDIPMGENAQATAVAQAIEDYVLSLDPSTRCKIASDIAAKTKPLFVSI